MESNLSAYVSRMLAGDAKAFSAFYEATSKRVYFICISFLKNEHDAKDIMQEVYLTAWQKLHLLKEADKIQGWLERIAVNKCRDHLKRNAPIPTEEEVLEGILPAEEELQFSEEYITTSEKRRVIMELLRTRLSDLQYQTVILYYFNGLSVRETASIMQCSEGSVKNRLSEARRKIRQGVEEYEKEHATKLHSAVPLLTLLLQEEAKGMQVPDLSGFLTSEAMKSAGKGVLKTAGRKGIPMLKGKLIAAAAIIATGGTAAVLYTQNHSDPTEPEIQQAILPETVPETTAPAETALIFTETIPETTVPEETATTAESTNTTEPLTTIASATTVLSITETIPVLTEPTAAEPETYAVTRENIIKGYQNVLDELRYFDNWEEKFAMNGEDEKGTYPLEFQYTLCDMDQNGVPELIVLYGLHVYAEAVSFYTFDESGVRYLGDGGGYASGFSYDTETHQLVIGSGHMGIYWYQWYAIENGKLTETRYEDLNIIREDQTGPEYYDNAYWEEWEAEQHLVNLDTAYYDRVFNNTTVWTYQNGEAQYTEYPGFDYTFLESYPY